MPYKRGGGLVVTPEGSTGVLSSWSQKFWSKGTQEHSANALLLIGATRFESIRKSSLSKDDNDDYRIIKQNGLWDAYSDKWYGSTFNMPIGMWTPWSEDDNYPPQLRNITQLISTPWGEAAYLICYEEMIPSVLTVKMLAGKAPVLLISASNQWFASNATEGYRAQKRSVNIQARFWGLAHIRSVNYPLQSP